MTNQLLDHAKLELYEILGCMDLLITDYSSIYFDYLLLNRPIIFTPTDLEEYRETRGFLLEPYDFWTPGPKVTSQKALQHEILKSLCDIKYFQSERETILSIIHQYRDNKSSERLWNMIDRILEGEEDY